jgi:hypothetical protein
MMDLLIVLVQLLYLNKPSIAVRSSAEAECRYGPPPAPAKTGIAYPANMAPSTNNCRYNFFMMDLLTVLKSFSIGQAMYRGSIIN